MLNHRSRSLALALATVLGAAGCDGEDKVTLGSPARSPDAGPAAGELSIDPEAPAIAGFTAIGTCAMDLPVCGSDATAPCTLRCGARANGCISYSEYVPLTTNDDADHELVFGAIDPEGQWAFYRRESSLAPRESTLYRWSAQAGNEALAELMGLPASTPEVAQATVVVEVGAAGEPVLLLGFENDQANHGYIWTRDAGLARLDFVPWDMSSDGRVVVGARGGAAVVWDRAAGLRRLDGAALDAPPFTPPGGVPDDLARLTSVRWIRVSESGDLVLSVENSGFGFRWSEALGVVPLDGLPGFPEDASVDLADLESGALVVSRARSEREPLRLWWWGDAVGAVELETLPDQESSFRRSASLLRGTGGVIVGDEASSFGDVAVFRWSAERGTERVSPPSTLNRPLYANPDGTTIVGQSSVGVRSDTFRWTANGGVSVIPEGGGTSLIALGGDVLIAPAPSAADGGDERPTPRVLKFDRALETGDALPIDLVAAASTADRDAAEVGVSAISENARLLAGTTLDAQGSRRAWVLRLRDSCDAP